MGLEESRLPPNDMNDLLRDTNYTYEEIEGMYKKFAGKYPNGHMNIEEFKSVFQSTFPEGDASEFAEHVFRAFDTNNDGVVDFREYLFVLHVSSHGRIDEKLKLAFTLYDIDRNGIVTWPELEKVLKSVHKAMGIRRMLSEEENLSKRISDLFNHIDRKNKGRFTFQDFINSVSSDPDILRQIRYDPLSLH